MANAVEFEILGADKSGPAMKAAIGNVERLGREVSTMTRTIGIASAAMSSFGNTALATTAAHLQTFGAAAQLAQANFSKIGTARLATWGVIGAVIAAATYAITQKTEAYERAEAAEQAALGLQDQMTLALAQYTRQSNVALEVEQIRYRAQQQRIEALGTEGAAVEHLVRMNDDLNRKAREQIELQNEKGMIRLGQDLNAMGGQMIRSSSFGGGERAYEKYTPDQAQQILATERMYDTMIEQYQKYTDDKLAIGAFVAQVEEQRAARLKEMVIRFDKEANKAKLQSASMYMTQSGNIMGSLATLADALGKKNFALTQGLRYGEAVMHTAAGITRAFAEYTWPYSAVVAAAVATAGAAQIATIAAAKPSGQAHAGMDYIPREGSYILQRGEMVPDPGTSANLRQMAADYAGGGGIKQITINVGGESLTRLLLRMSRDGRLQIHERSII